MSLLQLPVPALTSLFSSLDTLSIGKLSLTCRFFDAFLQDPVLWRYRLRREFPEATLQGILPADYRDYYLRLYSLKLRRLYLNRPPEYVRILREKEELERRLEELNTQLNDILQADAPRVARLLKEAKIIGKNIKLVVPEGERRYFTYCLPSEAMVNHLDREVREWGYLDELMKTLKKYELTPDTHQRYDLIRITHPGEGDVKMAKILISVGIDLSGHITYHKYYKCLPDWAYRLPWTPEKFKKVYKLPFPVK